MIIQERLFQTGKRKLRNSFHAVWSVLSSPFNYCYHNRMKIRITGLIFVLLVAGFASFGGAKPVQAAAAYDPNNIMRDDVFTNVASMSQTDIQNFLVAHNSCCPQQLG